MEPEPGAATAFPLNQIYFYLTQGCNLRCRHCWISPKFSGENRSYPSLDFDLFRSILKQAQPLGLSAVKLTGGEPLIHPRIDEIIQHIKDRDLSLSVETNGVACTTEIAAKIKSCKDPFVSVSLDGADATTHEWVRGVPGCFDAALEGIRNLVAEGLNPEIIMSIMRRNKDQVEAVVDLAETLGAASVKFNVIQPVARGESMFLHDETLPIEDLVELGAEIETHLSESRSIRLIYSHPAAFRPLSRMFGPAGDGCHVCGILGILGVLGDDSYALCGIGETVPELVFGHASQDSLEQIWNNSPILVEIRDGLPGRLQGICGECLMKATCLGSCIAMNYYANKNLWAPFWFCEAARDKGLFPETRRLCLREPRP